MHLHHDHVGCHCHDHEHSHTHEHTHDGVAHTHEHTHVHEHSHDGHTHSHEELHAMGIPHEHEHHHHEDCGCGHDHSHGCAGCQGGCEHTPLEELMALMKYMVGHNAAHAKELADLAAQLEQIGSHAAYEQVMAAVSDFEKGNMRLSMVLAGMEK